MRVISQTHKTRQKLTMGKRLYSFAEAFHTYNVWTFEIILTI